MIHIKIVKVLSDGTLCSSWAEDETSIKYSPNFWSISDNGLYTYTGRNLDECLDIAYDFFHGRNSIQEPQIWMCRVRNRTKKIPPYGCAINE